jgi:HEAT repeat protein
MTELDFWLAELTCGEDIRAEAAAVRLPDFGRAALKALSPWLRAELADVRWWAVRSLAGFEHSAAIVDSLIAALDDEADEIRQCAALGLSHHPDPRAIAPLIRALSDSDALTAKIAANALILIGKHATPQLIDVLQTGTPAAKLEAVRALAEIKDSRAIPALMKLLQTDSVITQYRAELGLDQLGLGMLYVEPE